MGGIFLQIIISLASISLLLFLFWKLQIVIKKKKSKKNKEIINSLLDNFEIIVNANIDFKSRFSFYLSKISNQHYSNWRKDNEGIYNKIQKYDYANLLKGQTLNEYVEFDLAFRKGWEIIQKFNSDFYNFNQLQAETTKTTIDVPTKVTYVKPVVKKPLVVKPKVLVKEYPERKKNWKAFEIIVQNNRIEKLYHFTDEANLLSIISNKGLYSWNDCLNKKISIPKPGGNQLSRDLDRRFNLENFVQLSFNRNHPMMYVVKRDGRINNPVILEISPDVIYLRSTKFSNMNSTSNSASIGTTLEHLTNIKFQIAKSSVQYYNLNQNDKPFYQAEVLVENYIPIEKILNINTYNVYSN